MLRYRVHVVYAVATAVTSIEGHREVVKAVEASDPELTVALLQRHIQQAKEDILKHVLHDDGHEQTSH